MKEKIFTWTGPAALKLLLIVIVVFSVRPAQAQDNPLLYKEIQLVKKTYTFDELTYVIQQQTGITFSYNASKIHSTRSFRIKTNRITAVKLLEIIKQHSGIGYRIVNPELIIYTPPVTVHYRHREKKTVKKVPAASKEKNLIPKGKKQTTITATESQRNGNQGNASENKNGNAPSDSSTQTVVVIGDSAIAYGYYIGGGGGDMGTIHMVMHYPGRNANTGNPYASLNPPEGSSKDWYKPSSGGNPDITAFIKKNILMDAGISADKTYYFSPTLHLGFRFLYATLSYNTGAYPQWRYGLGAEARVNDKWSLRVDFNTGKKFSESFAFPTFDTIILPPPDSLSPPPPPLITEKDIPLTVQSQLTRFSFSVARQFTKNFSLAAGITLNRLKSRYFSEGQPFDLNNIEPPIPDADNRFGTIKPPYVLKQSYNPADAAGLKLWLGFRITILYRLSFGGG